MLLIDRDSKPEDTVFYLATRLLADIKKRGQVNLGLIEQLYEGIDRKQPEFKYTLALNFLFLIEKVTVKGGDLVYVPKKS